jgi:hypothetical protein
MRFALFMIMPDVSVRKWMMVFEASYGSQLPAQ